MIFLELVSVFGGKTYFGGIHSYVGVSIWRNWVYRLLQNSSV